MPQYPKPPDIDFNGNPISDKPPDIDFSGNPIPPHKLTPLERVVAGLPQEETSFMGRVGESIPQGLSDWWEARNKPHWEGPSKAARWLTQDIGNEPPNPLDPFSWIPYATKHGVNLAGDIASGFTSDMGILQGLTFPLGGAAAKMGLPLASKLLTGAGAVSSVPYIGTGAYHVSEGKTAAEKVLGGLEMVGGAAGAYAPNIMSKIGKAAATGAEAIPESGLRIRSLGEATPGPKVLDDIEAPSFDPNIPPPPSGGNVVDVPIRKPKIPLGDELEIRTPEEMVTGPREMGEDIFKEQPPALFDDEDIRPITRPAAGGTEVTLNMDEAPPLPHEVEVIEPTKEKVKDLKAKGYRATGETGPNGYPVMRLPGAAPKTIQEVLKEGGVEPTGNREVKGTTERGPGYEKVLEAQQKGEVTVSTLEEMNQWKERGWEVVDQLDNGDALMRPIPPNKYRPTVRERIEGSEATRPIARTAADLLRRRIDEILNKPEHTPADLEQIKKLQKEWEVLTKNTPTEEAPIEPLSAREPISPFDKGREPAYIAPRAKDVTEARAQYKRLEEDYQKAVASGDADAIESIGQMRDNAIEQMAEMNTAEINARNRPNWVNPKTGQPTEGPVPSKVIKAEPQSLDEYNKGLEKWMDENEPSDARQPRILPDQLMDPVSLEKKLLTISRMKRGRALEEVSRLDDVLEEARIRVPDRIHTIAQIEQMRDAAVKAAGGEVPLREPSSAKEVDPFDLMRGSEGRGLGKESFEQQWADSVREAEILGIDWKAYDNLDELQWHITRKAAQETMRTGKNPLADEPLGPSNARIPRQEFIEPEEVSKRMEDGLPYSTNPNDTRFILPNGTSLTHDFNIHAEAAESVGLNLNDVLDAGVIRIARDWIAGEVWKPITIKQATELAKGTTRLGRTIFVEVNHGGSELLSVDIHPGATPASIMKDVNALFESGEYRGPSSLGVTGKVGPSGLPNIALGGADPEVLDALGTSLYTADSPLSVTKELFQNAWDELKISGMGGPIRLVFEYGAEHPITGADAKSITIKDFGRGMNSDELLTIFSDVGKSGKRTTAQASGGFGFAKAAPFLGGDYMRVESIALVEGEKIKFTFEGTPEQFKDQKVGVPLDQESVPFETPTGFEVEVFFGDDRDISTPRTYLEKLVKGSPAVKDVHLYENFSVKSKARAFLDRGWIDPTDMNRYKLLEGQPIPQKMADINTPEMDAGIHYELDDLERKSGTLTILNNGLWVKDVNIGYGWHEKPHLPKKIVADIHPLIEEGKKGYPFGLNREEITTKVMKDIDDWIEDKIKKPAEDLRKAELKKAYDDMQPDSPLDKYIVYDSGEKYTPQERQRFVNATATREIGDVMDGMLQELNNLFSNEQYGGKTEKFGFYVQGPGRGGMNLPSMVPGAKKNAILIDYLSPIVNETDPQYAAERIAHFILHEFTHNLVRDEGAGFTWAFSKTQPKFGRRINDVVQRIEAAISDGKGGFNREITELLQDYTSSRGRAEVKKDILSREREPYSFIKSGSAGDGGSVSRIGEGTTPKRIDAHKEFDRIWNEIESEAAAPSEGPVDIDTIRRDLPQPQIPGMINEVNRQADVAKMTRDPVERESLIRQALDLNRTMITAYDMSAPLRQGLPLITRKEFWTSLDDMLKSWGSETGYEMVMRSIDDHPSGYFKKQAAPDASGVMKEGPSFAEQVGLDLTDAITRREEAFRSKIADKIPGVRRSNRAFTAYLNKLRSDTFVALMDAVKAEGRNPMTDRVISENIATFINNATGRGSLTVKIPKVPMPGTGRNLITGREINLATEAKTLTDIFFAPQLASSRIRMYTQVLNPKMYTTMDPVVRKATLKSLFTMAGTGMLIGELAKLAGAEVSNDPTSADFRKIRIGDTRIDMFGGHQQYLVAAARMLTGQYTSSIDPTSVTDLSAGEFGRQTRTSVMGQFAANKLAPVPSLALSWMSGRDFDGMPFDMKVALARRITPIIFQDLKDLYDDDPSMVPYIVAPFFGAGIQTYGR